MQSLSPFDRPLTIGEVLDRTFRLYRKNIGLLLLTAAALLIPYSIITGLLTGQAMVGYLDFIENLSNAQFDPDSSAEDMFGMPLPQVFGFAGIIILVSIIGGLLNAATTLALTRQEIGILNDEKLSLGEGLRAGAGRLLPYIGMVIVQFVAYIGIVIGTLIVFACAFFALALVFGGAASAFSDPFGPGFGTSEPSGAAIAGIIIGVMCLYLIAIAAMLLPASYFTARWSAAVPALVDQKLGPIAALGYSWDITKGHVRRSFFFIVLLTILSVIFVSVPVGVITQVGSLAMLGTNQAFFQSISTILASIFTVIWLPLYTTAYVMHYYDLRVRQEGFDLSKRIDKLESDLKPDLKPYSPL